MLDTDCHEHNHHKCHHHHHPPSIWLRFHVVLLYICLRVHTTSLVDALFYVIVMSIAKATKGSIRWLSAELLVVNSKRCRRCLFASFWNQVTLHLLTLIQPLDLLLLLLLLRQCADAALRIKLGAALRIGGGTRLFRRGYGYIVKLTDVEQVSKLVSATLFDPARQRQRIGAE